MKGCIRILEINQPCIAPSNITPMTDARTAIGHGKFHPRSMITKITPCRAKIDPMERSMPPVIMTKPIPMLKMPYIPISRAMFSKFAWPRNRGFRAVVIAQSATSRMVIPSSFFILVGKKKKGWL